MAALDIELHSFPHVMGALGNKEIDFGSDTFKVAVCASTAVTIDPDTMGYFDDIAATLAVYTLTNVTYTYDATNNRYVFDADDVAETDQTFADGDIIVVFDDTPATDATKPLVGYGLVSGGGYNPSGGAVTMTWPAAGIFTYTAS